MINVQFSRDLVKSLIIFIQREPVNIIKSRLRIRKRTLVPQRPGRHSEIYSSQYISTIDRTIDYLVKEKNTSNISSGTRTCCLTLLVKRSKAPSCWNLIQHRNDRGRYSPVKCSGRARYRKIKYFLPPIRERMR
ncbi:hypothetical protein AVEN_179851-1 [Araneus ventricosus]|uniref:Uncharacterized protein n=1 Tax=Araneus ventricosus TaxID=182803 RepID=A0A4Y2LKU1_ARAVE|nr:hypothetical protein AVEN_179851-1 [Araneus ventricosus]